MKSKHVVVGVDVGKNFCYYAILSPTGALVAKPKKMSVNKSGLGSMLKKVKEAEKTYGYKSVIILESTGHYSNRLVHFFTHQGMSVCLINPLLSHSIKNSTIRKVKTDKVDAMGLAQLYFLKDLQETTLAQDAYENLKVLTRAYSALSKQRTLYINRLTVALDHSMPNYTKVFSTVNTKASLAVLSSFNSPQAIINAPKQDVIKLITSTSRRGLEYAKKKYSLLLHCAKEAQIIGVKASSYAFLITANVKYLFFIDEQMKDMKQEIDILLENMKDYEYVLSIPAIGPKLAAIIIAEVGDITRFKNAKQLVAFSGIDPSVRQSGNFVGSKNRLTKRGSPFLRRALYLAAAISIRKHSNGSYVNKVIYDYYQEKVKVKSRKVALGAVMNKLVRIVFSVLKNKHPFILITPQQQKIMYKNLVA